MVNRSINFFMSAIPIGWFLSILLLCYTFPIFTLSSSTGNINNKNRHITYFDGLPLSCWAFLMTSSIWLGVWHFSHNNQLSNLKYSESYSSSFQKTSFPLRLLFHASHVLAIRGLEPTIYGGYRHALWKFWYRAKISISSVQTYILYLLYGLGPTIWFGTYYIVLFNIACL